MNTKLQFLLIILVFLWGCKSPTSPDALDAMQQLTVGNSWTYQDSSLGPPGFIDTNTYTITITGTTFINGKTYAVFNDFLTGPTRNDEQGTWAIRPDSAFKEHLLFKYPGSVGDEFDFDTTIGETMDLTEHIIYGHAYIITTDTLITVPSGTYKCYGYEYNYFILPDATPFRKSVYYSSLNAGSVKDEEYSWDVRKKAFSWESTSVLIGKNIK